MTTAEKIRQDMIICIADLRELLVRHESGFLSTEKLALYAQEGLDVAKNNVNYLASTLAEGE